MCDLNHHHEHGDFGFIVDVPEIRALIDERAPGGTIRDHAARVEALRPAFARFSRPMGGCQTVCSTGCDQRHGGLGLASTRCIATKQARCAVLTRRATGSSTPVHDLSRGAVVVYRGAQSEHHLARLDDAGVRGEGGRLQVASQQTVGAGEFIRCWPRRDIHT